LIRREINKEEEEEKKKYTVVAGIGLMGTHPQP
jgi:hypothetical protein